MATQPLESIAALMAHHLPNMDLPHKRALVLRYEGRRDRESATIEGVSEGTIKQRIGISSAEIAMCLPLHVRLSGEMRGGWIQAHLACCLADAMAQLSGPAV